MIDIFDGKYWFLSNFYSSPIKYKNILYATAEHFFQSMKTKDEKQRNEIINSRSPNLAKYYGRKVTIRGDWESIKNKVMLKAVRLKFLQNEDIKKLLIATDDEILIEGNYWHDNYWGDCKCVKCKDIKGHNMLGKILMKVREEIK